MSQDFNLKYCIWALDRDQNTTGTPQELYVASLFDPLELNAFKVRETILYFKLFHFHIILSSEIDATHCTEKLLQDWW